jgi:hypothetical protein
MNETRRANFKNSIAFKSLVNWITSDAREILVARTDFDQSHRLRMLKVETGYM